MVVVWQPSFKYLLHLIQNRRRPSVKNAGDTFYTQQHTQGLSCKSKLLASSALLMLLLQIDYCYYSDITQNIKHFYINICGGQKLSLWHRWSNKYQSRRCLIILLHQNVLNTYCFGACMSHPWWCSHRTFFPILTLPVFYLSSHTALHLSLLIGWSQNVLCTYHGGFRILLRCLRVTSSVCMRHQCRCSHRSLFPNSPPPLS